MSKIGIDLGTTYTTLCYVNERKQPLDVGYIEVFRDGENLSIPSMVAYEKATGAFVAIGDSARDLVGDVGHTVFQHFKMLLAKEDTPELESFIAQRPDYAMYLEKKPSQVAQDFLFHLLSGFKNSQSVEHIDKVVITIPLVWDGLAQQLGGNTGNAKARVLTALKAACAELAPAGKKTQIQVKSEPEAAAGYFAHEHLRQEGQAFEGDMLVVDYGGGTLDLTLAQVQRKPDGTVALSTKEVSGGGKSLDHGLGVAGVAYDQKLAEIVLGERRSEFSAQKWQSFLNILEQKKRQGTVRKAINRYSVLHVNKQAFNFEDGTRVMPQDCEKAFNAANRDHLKVALEEVCGGDDKLKRLKDPDIKVVLVGGFSNLPFVELFVRESMGIEKELDSAGELKRPLTDKRMSLNRTQDRQCAIAMGAALVAAQQLSIDDQKTRFHLGFWVRTTNGDDLGYREIFPKGLPYDQLKETKWAMSSDAKHPVALSGGGGLVFGYKESSDRSVTPRAIKSEDLRLRGGNGKQSFAALIPEYSGDCMWNIGFCVRLDENDSTGDPEFYLVVRNIGIDRRDGSPSPIDNPRVDQVAMYPFNRLHQEVHGTVIEQSGVYSDEEIKRAAAYQKFIVGKKK